MAEIRRVHMVNSGVYRVQKIWRHLARDGCPVARCTAARMQAISLDGVIRRRRVRTTVRDLAAACPLDHVERQYKAECPNWLWVADFTHVAAKSGFV